MVVYLSSIYKRSPLKQTQACGLAWAYSHREYAHAMLLVKIIIMRFCGDAASPFKFATRQGVSVF